MSQDLNNSGLISLCIKGDEKAWSVFVERFANLIRWAIKDRLSRSPFLPDENEINDIFQHIFTDIWQNNRLRNLKNLRAISSWLVVIAQNTTLNFIRERSKIPKLNIEEIGEEVELPTQNNPRTETENSQLYEMVEELIKEMPLKEQRIITLELFYDLKHREIANIMGMPINTVSTIIARIKKDLKDSLIKRGYDV